MIKRKTGRTKPRQTAMQWLWLLLGMILGMMLSRFLLRWRIRRRIRTWLPQTTVPRIRDLPDYVAGLLRGLREENRARMDLAHQLAELERVGWDFLCRHPLPLVVLDRSGRLIGWNDRASTCLDLPSAPARPLKAPHLAYWMVFPDPAFRDAIARVLDRYVTEHWSWSRRVGRFEQAFAITACPLPWPGRDLVILLLEDRLQQKHLQQYKHEMLDLLIHELRSPLTGILSALELLETPQDRAAAQRIIERQVERLDRLLQRMETLARAEHTEALPHEELDLVALLQEAVELARAAHPERNVQVKLEGPQRLDLHGWPEMLQILFQNLVDNAIKFAPEGTQVVVRCRRDAAHVVVEVEDQGPGIPEPEQERVFERFYRGRDAIEKGLAGTGLGLSLVKHIAALHGARIDLQSQVGRGTRFVLTFPPA